VPSKDQYGIQTITSVSNQDMPQTYLIYNGKTTSWKHFASSHLAQMICSAIKLCIMLISCCKFFEIEHWYKSPILLDHQQNSFVQNNKEPSK